MFPTNPSYIRRVVKSDTGCERVRVSPSTGDVFVKHPGSEWAFYANTSVLIKKWDAENAAKRRAQTADLAAIASS